MFKYNDFGKGNTRAIRKITFGELLTPMPVPCPNEKGRGLGREYSNLPVKLT
jgi:hypothetical protein